MNMLPKPSELEPAEGPLYEARRKVYPQSVSGTFRSIKWRLMAVCLGVYYFLPFVRWYRGEGAPTQAVLVDLPNSRFYFFFIELWPQEVYYFTGLLIVAALTLFLMNALGGRIWCGYLCPQTVWTDLFYAVERLIEGDRRERMRKDAEAHAEEDKARKEEVETRNEADNAVYRSEKLLKDNGDKLAAKDKSQIESAVAAVKEALKGSDAAAIKSASEKLNEAWQAASAELYKAGAAKAQGAAGQPGAQPQEEAKPEDKKKDEGVIDAEVVDEKKP